MKGIWPKRRWECSKAGDRVGRLGSSCSVTAVELELSGLEGPGSSSDDTSALPELQGFVWDTPVPGEGYGLQTPPLLLPHVGDLLRGLKVRPPQSPSVTSPRHHRETAEVSPLWLTQLIAEQQEGVKHPSKEWSPVHPNGAPSSCVLQPATCRCPWITLCMGDPLAPVQSP